MFQMPLDDIDEEALRRLGESATEETVRLEFKRELSLSRREERRELAKDVSALANTAGGRIIYGIEERILDDGTRCAGAISPLTNASVVESLQNIIASSIVPRPKYRSRCIEVQGGFVLVVEVYPSYGNDLFMVSGYDESRFYRRAEQHIDRMTEPEIRQAYARVARTLTDLETSVERHVAGERLLRVNSRDSILIVPWFSRIGLADPARIITVHEAMERVAGISIDFLTLLHCLRVTGFGMKAILPENSNDRDAASLLSISKSGILHYSTNHSIERNGYSVPLLIRDICNAMQLASIVFDRVGYWGPVRLIHILRSSVSLRLARWIGDTSDATLPSGELEHVVGEVRLEELRDTPSEVVRSIVDQVFHHIGEAGCPYFDGAGRVVPRFRSLIPEILP